MMRQRGYSGEVGVDLVAPSWAGYSECQDASVMKSLAWGMWTGSGAAGRHVDWFEFHWFAFPLQQAPKPSAARLPFTYFTVFGQHDGLLLRHLRLHPSPARTCCTRAGPWVTVITSLPWPRCNLPQLARLPCFPRQTPSGARLPFTCFTVFTSVPTWQEQEESSALAVSSAVSPRSLRGCPRRCVAICWGLLQGALGCMWPAPIWGRWVGGGGARVPSSPILCWHKIWLVGAWRKLSAS